MKIACTGHRPGHLFGYDLHISKYHELKELIKTYLVQKRCTEAYCGMALGADTIFALAVIELKKSGYPIKLICAIPMRPKIQCKYWKQEDIDRYAYILSYADEKVVVTKGENMDKYQVIQALHQRNIYG